MVRGAWVVVVLAAVSACGQDPSVCEGEPVPWDTGLYPNHAPTVDAVPLDLPFDPVTPDGIGRLVRVDWSGAREPSERTLILVFRTDLGQVWLEERAAPGDIPYELRAPMACGERHTLLIPDLGPALYTNGLVQRLAWIDGEVALTIWTDPAIAGEDDLVRMARLVSA